MLFTSLPFVVFFIVFFLLYWYVFSKSATAQNLLILVASYTFYAWWDWRFLFLLTGSSLLSYFLGLGIGGTKNSGVRNFLLGVGLAQGLGCLLFFKYFNFFAASLSSGLAAAGVRA